MPLIPALGRQGQVNLCKFKASQAYLVSSRTARASYRERNFLSQKKKKNKKTKKLKKKEKTKKKNFSQ